METDYNTWERNIATKAKVDSLNALKDEEAAKLDIIEKKNEAEIKNIEETNQAKIDQLNLFQETYNNSVEEDGVTKIDALTTLMANLKKTEDASYSERIKALQQYINDYNAKMAAMNASATGEKVSSNIPVISETKIPTAPTKYIEKGTSGIAQKVAIKKYAGGGKITETGIIQVDGNPIAPEGILSSKQLNLFEKFVSFLPDLNNIKVPQVALSGASNSNSGGDTLHVGTLNITTNDASQFFNKIKRQFRSN
jgi:hypothetical protein